MSEKHKFNDAVIKIKTAFELLETAEEELRELGISVNCFTSCTVPFLERKHHVLLNSGLNTVSILSDTEIRDDLYSDRSYGAVELDGFYFNQEKMPVMPVRREDRYA